MRMVAEQQRSTQSVTKELGISVDTLRNWLKAAGQQPTQLNRDNRAARRVKELEAENRSLRKSIDQKDGVIDVLKKSIGILSKP